MSWAAQNPQILGAVVLGGHPNGLDDLTAQMAFATLVRLLICECRAGEVPAALADNISEDDKTGWSTRVENWLADASDDFELSPLERRRKKLSQSAEFISMTGGG